MQLKQIGRRTPTHTRTSSIGVIIRLRGLSRRTEVNMHAAGKTFSFAGVNAVVTAEPSYSVKYLR